MSKSKIEWTENTWNPAFLLLVLVASGYWAYCSETDQAASYYEVA